MINPSLYTRFYSSLDREIQGLLHSCMSTACVTSAPNGGPRVVVSTAAFHARVQGSFPGLGSLK